MINLLQYEKLCVSCDKILDKASSKDEIVSIPILHVLREHPECLKLYSEIFNSDAKKNSSKDKSSFINLLGKAIGLLKSSVLDYKFYNFPNISDNSKKIIIVSHITNQNQCNNFDDEYFGKLPNDLINSSELRPIVLLINQTSISSKILSKKLLENNIDRVVIPKSSGLINEVRIFIKLVISVFSFLKFTKFEDPTVNSVLKLIAKPRIFLSGLSAIRIGYFIEKTVKASKSNYLLTTYEGHARERIIFSSARKANKNILCYAYQHSILNKYQHSLTRNIENRFNPNHIFCCGKITYDKLIEMKSLDSVGISILGSPKGLPIDNEIKLSFRNKNLTFLFLPEGQYSEYKIFFDLILDCANLLPDHNFIWRSHPIMDLERLDIIEGICLPKNLSISCNALDDDLKASDIAVYRGTTAVIRAVIANLVPIYIKTEGEIGIDIMHSLDLNRVSSALEIKSILEKGKLSENNLSAINFCQNYNLPLNLKSFLKEII